MLASSLQRKAQRVAVRCSCKANKARTPFQSGAGPFTPRPSRSQRDLVTVHFFKFGKNGMKADDAGIYASQGRDDYDKDDVEHYFNYMGMLAVDGSYDKMYEMVNTGMHPVDIILLWACQENDAPKVQELLIAGADITVKNLQGKTAFDLATKPEILDMLKEYQLKQAAA